ncbi:MAG: bifunctional nuclease family protein, partial [Pseudonocardia sp.]|nr:bifunctional nuclease family protein [Pseudonocardia sp.]
GFNKGDVREVRGVAPFGCTRGVDADREREHPAVMKECTVVALGIDAGHAGPVMLLQEVQQPRRVLPIWIGMAEAAALETHRNAIPAPRPSTHQLLADLVAALGRRVERTQITALDGTVFLGELVFDQGLTVSARPSDAVTLAAVLHVPVFVDDAVLAEAAVDEAHVLGPGDEQTPDTPLGPGMDAPDPRDVEREVSDFRRLLDDVDPKDFGSD